MFIPEITFAPCWSSQLWFHARISQFIFGHKAGIYLFLSFGFFGFFYLGFCGLLWQFEQVILAAVTLLLSGNLTHVDCWRDIVCICWHFPIVKFLYIIYYTMSNHAVMLTTARGQSHTLLTVLSWSIYLSIYVCQRMQGSGNRLPPHVAYLQVGYHHTAGVRNIFLVHCAGDTNMFPHYNLSPCCEDISPT